MAITTVTFTTALVEFRELSVIAIVIAKLISAIAIVAITATIVATRSFVNVANSEGATTTTIIVSIVVVVACESSDADGEQQLEQKHASSS